MADFRMTWFFKSDTYGIGWTENWWTAATDAPTALTQVANYLVVRKALLNDVASIYAVRACSVDHPRDSLYLGSGLPVAGTIVTATYPIAGVWDCVLCRRDIGTYNLLGHQFLHMVPAGVFTGRNMAISPSPSAWTAAFTAFGTEVTNGTYLLRKRTAPTTYSYLPCTIFLAQRRTERRLGRPFDELRGRRAVA